MKKLVMCFLIFVQAFSIAYAQAPQMVLDEYCPVLARCNIAAYAVAKYLVANTKNAESEKLKTLSAPFAQLARDFQAKLADLEAVTPQGSEFQVIHRVFISQYRQINIWIKDLEKDFNAGNNFALLWDISKGKYLLRNLKDTYAMFNRSLNSVTN